MRKRQAGVGLIAAVWCMCAAAQVAPKWEVGPFVRQNESALVGASHPAAVVKDGKVFLLFVTENDASSNGERASRLSLAESPDGLHFTLCAAPVQIVGEDEQGPGAQAVRREDPRIVEAEDGSYVLTYTQWNGQKEQTEVATSKDLIHWTGHGPAFAGAAGGRYEEMPYKAAGILTRFDREKGRLVAARIEDRYWMYWGEGALHVASSDDLLHWTPLVGRDGAPAELLTVRQGRFDSAQLEVGPPPVLTPYGILVVYNGKNAAGKRGAEAGDRSIAAGAYAVGEALFDPFDPVRPLARLPDPVLKPETVSGKNGPSTPDNTFAEGLVFWRGQWMLYYGAGEVRVAVAKEGAVGNQ